MSGRLNPRQFEQEQLFSPYGVPLKQPHQMSRMEFAQQPDTMWHSSYSADIEDLRKSYDHASDRSAHWGGTGPELTTVETQGFHTGTLGAAVQRVAGSLGKRSEGGREWLHPVRLTPEAEGQMQNTPELKASDNIAGPPRGIDQGDDWTPDDHYSYYRNQHEDPGSISAVVESPHDVRTHADYVEDAMRTPGRIPSGAARWETEQRGRLGTGFRLRDVEAAQDRETAQRSPYYGGAAKRHWLEAGYDTSHSDLTIQGYRNPLESPSTRVWGLEKGEQQTLFNPGQYRRR